jgi:hypothetical protein
VDARVSAKAAAPPTWPTPMMAILEPDLFSIIDGVEEHFCGFDFVSGHLEILKHF